MVDRCHPRAARGSTHTWPLATDITHLSRLDNADTKLNAWGVSWVAHRLPQAPFGLFDANIFHPNRNTLAYSEPLIPTVLVGAPMRWLGASPVTTYNVLLLAGMVTTGLSMYVLVLRFTGDHVAGLCAGCLFVFNAHTLTRIPHLQAFHAQWLPLALWALDRLLGGNRRRDALWLALFVSLAALTSGYLAVMTVVMLLAAFIVRPDRWLRPQGLSFVGSLAIGAAVAVGISAVVLWPYAMTAQGALLERPLSEVAIHSATVNDYLATGGRWHYAAWSHRFYQLGADALFPGGMALMLAIIALAAGRKADRGRVGMLVAIGLAGVVLSFGPATPVYEWVYAVFPPLRSIRAASRFGYLLLFAVAGLAGLGLATVRRIWPQRRWVTGITLCLIAVVNLEALRAPMGYLHFRGFSQIYEAIASDPEAQVVVEFPFYQLRRVDANADYVLASTVHWKPLVNGYSGLVPPSYVEAADKLQNFPTPDTLRYLDALGVTHLVVHHWRYGDREQAARLLRDVRACPQLELLSVDAFGSRLYRFHPDADVRRNLDALTGRMRKSRSRAIDTSPRTGSTSSRRRVPVLRTAR